MAAINPQSRLVVGVDLTSFTPTATTGDTFPPGCTVLISNASGSPINITVTVPGTDNYGSARPDYVKACANNALTAVGPLPQDLADPTTNLVTIVCSAVSSVKGYAFS